MPSGFNSFDVCVSLIKELGQEAASLKNDTTKIDDKTELNVFATGWEAIKQKATNKGANEFDINALESNMKSELASLMGAEFGKSAGAKVEYTENNKPVFSEEEISLENMMNLLSDTDGIDMNKIREYNKKPMETYPSAFVDLIKYGFSPSLAAAFIDAMPGSFEYVKEALVEKQERKGDESYISRGSTTELPETDVPL